jgi:hypothetical protein
MAPGDFGAIFFAAFAVLRRSSAGRGGSGSPMRRASTFPEASEERDEFVVGLALPNADLAERVRGRALDRGGRVGDGAKFDGHVTHTRSDCMRGVPLQGLHGLVEWKGLAHALSLAAARSDHVRRFIPRSMTFGPRRRSSRLRASAADAVGIRGHFGVEWR